MSKLDKLIAIHSVKAMYKQKKMSKLDKIIALSAIDKVYKRVK